MFVVQLGDQLADWNTAVSHRRADQIIAAEFGVKVKDVDINGSERTLNFNLNNNVPILADEVNAFVDIVTDFGTIEHTDDIYAAMYNVFSCVTGGGISIHANPDHTYERHGNFYFTPQFWNKFCELTDSELLLVESVPVYQPDNPHHELYAVVRHGEQFPDRETWDKEMKPHYSRWN